MSEQVKHIKMFPLASSKLSDLVNFMNALEARGSVIGVGQDDEGQTYVWAEVIGNDPYPVDKNNGLPYGRCPHCDANLSEVGVGGLQVIDFRSSVNPDDHTFTDWEARFERYEGAQIYCSNCGNLIAVSGLLAPEGDRVV